MKAILITTCDSNSYANFLNADLNLISEKLKDFDISVSRGADLIGSGEGYFNQLGETIKNCDILFIAVQENPKVYADLSKTLSEGLDTKLIKENSAEEAILQCAISRNQSISAEYVSDFATIPESSVLFKNPASYIQSYMISSKKQLIFIVPVRPSDILNTLSGALVDYIRDFAKAKTPIFDEPVPEVPKPATAVIKATELSERSVPDLLYTLEKAENPKVTHHTTDNIYYTINISALADGEISADENLNQVISKIRTSLGNCIYAYDERNFYDICGELLKSHGLTLACAEHGTKGGFTEQLLEYQNIASIFKENSVFVGNDRLSSLCVPTRLVSRYGLISKQVALAMAYSAMKKAGTSLGLSLLLGDGLNQNQKICYICLCDSEYTWIKMLSTNDGNIQRLRNISIVHAFNILRLFCDNYGHTMAGHERISDLLKGSILRILSKSESSKFFRN